MKEFKFLIYTWTYILPSKPNKKNKEIATAAEEEIKKIKERVSLILKEHYTGNESLEPSYNFNEKNGAIGFKSINDLLSFLGVFVFDREAKGKLKKRINRLKDSFLTHIIDQVMSKKDSKLCFFLTPSEEELKIIVTYQHKSRKLEMDSSIEKIFCSKTIPLKQIIFFFEENSVKEELEHLLNSKDSNSTKKLSNLTSFLTKQRKTELEQNILSKFFDNNPEQWLQRIEEKLITLEKQYNNRPNSNNTNNEDSAEHSISLIKHLAGNPNDTFMSKLSRDPDANLMNKPSRPKNNDNLSTEEKTYNKPKEETLNSLENQPRKTTFCETICCCFFNKTSAAKTLDVQEPLLKTENSENEKLKHTENKKSFLIN